MAGSPQQRSAQGAEEVMQYLWRRLFLPSTYIPIALALGTSAVFLVLNGAVSDIWGAFDLNSFRIIAGLLLLIVSAASVQAVRRFRERGVLPILIHLAALAVLVSALTVYLFRFEGTLMMAEGEAYEPVAAAFSEIRKGPLARIPSPVFVLSSVPSKGQQPDFTIIPGAGGRNLSSRESVLVVEGVQLSLLKRSVMPLIELSADTGGTIAREYVRLDLDSPLGQDSFMFVNNPYEFTVRRIKDSADPGGVLLQISVRRGKLTVAEGKVDIRTPLKVVAMTLSMPEVKRSAIFQLRRQTGHGFFMTCCALFIAVNAWGVCLTLRRRHKEKREN